MQNINLIQNIRISLLIVIALCNFYTAKAQEKTIRPHEYIFTTYTAADGLSSSEILSLAIDKKGFLWAGTSAGLSRFDGYSFTNFFYSHDNHVIEMVNVVKADTPGRLWVGAGTGLYCYTQNRLIKISADTKSLQGINDIICEADGSLWLATENGPAFINKKYIDAIGAKKINLQSFILPQWKEKQTGRSDPACIIIKKADDGTIYFSNQYQLFRYAAGVIDLVHTNKEENDKIEFIIPVSNEKVFYNAATTGLNEVNKGIYKVIDFENLYQPGRKPLTEGTWYVGSLGIVCFHPDETFISENIVFEDKGASWLSLILKQDHIFWLATHNGLIKVNPSPFNLYTGDKFREINEIYSFCELKDGKFLMGGNRGNIYGANSEGVINFFPGGIKPVPNAEIKCMYEDERAWLWMGTGYQGIALYRNGKTTRFSEEANKLNDNTFNAFLKTSHNRLFAIGDKGMTEIIVDLAGNISFKPFYFPPENTKFAKFYEGIEASDGTVWIGGEEGLCFLQDDSLHQYTLLEKNISIRSIKIAKDNLVWIATAADGILYCRFDENNKLQVVKHYGTKEGLNTLQFLDLFIDKENNIWAGSVRGLTFIGRSPKHNGTVLNFSTSDGFIKPGYYNCKIYQDREGKIWVGTTQGIASFVPDDLIHSASAPKVYLTGVELLKETNKSINNDSLIEDNLRHNLSLPYYNNAINFNYTAVNFSSPDAIQYFYKLEGQDTSWIAMGTSRSIGFHNLSAGSYIFSVKAVNDKGRWSEDGPSFKFIISPPFWKTWWFQLSAAVLLIAFVSLTVRSSINSIKRKADIKQQMTELEVKALRAQMNPHFIFNAMNSIQQFTLKNDIDNANLYISRFSSLLRKVLYSSQQKFITVEEEIEQLKLYLDIEQLRMGHDFTFKIAVDENIETDALKIPGMLLQPFVENALKHGLAMKEDKRKLEIDFELLQNDELLISIIDNGIGREKAQQLKLEQEKMLPHQSRGIRLVEERLTLLYPSFPLHDIIRISNITDAAGNIAGTKVLITIQTGISSI